MLQFKHERDPDKNELNDIDIDVDIDFDIDQFPSDSYRFTTNFISSVFINIGIDIDIDINIVINIVQFRTVPVRFSIPISDIAHAYFNYKDPFY